MSNAADDPQPIAPDDPESQLLRDYRRARERRDDRAAVDLWEQLVLRHYDLMRTKIAWLSTRGDFRWLGRDEVDDVAQEAYFRAMTMALRFARDSIGQLRAALIQTATHTARDYQRRLDVRNRNVAGSLDETRGYDDGGEYNPWDAETAGAADWTGEQALGRIGAQRVIDAIEKIPNENQRSVIKLTWAGFSSKEIAARLDISVENVDQLRRRGLIKLKELLDDDGQD
jgi:RNA polymerase sigma factor (sigma-70 family)